MQACLGQWPEFWGQRQERPNLVKQRVERETRKLVRQAQRSGIPRRVVQHVGVDPKASADGATKCLCDICARGILCTNDCILGKSFLESPGFSRRGFRLDTNTSLGCRQRLADGLGGQPLLDEHLDHPRTGDSSLVAQGIQCIECRDGEPDPDRPCHGIVLGAAPSYGDPSSHAKSPGRPRGHAPGVIRFRLGGCQPRGL